MKKYLLLLLVFALCLSLCACRSSSADSPENPEPSESAGPEEILREHPLMDGLLGHWQVIDRFPDGLPYTDLLIRADGTCRVDEREAQWRITSDPSVTDSVTLMFYTDAGDICGAFYTGYFHAVDSYGGVYSGVFHRLYLENGEPTDIMTNILSFCGDWRESAEAEPFLSVFEDGTCIMDGKPGTWDIYVISDDRLNFTITVDGEVVADTYYQFDWGYFYIGNTFCCNFEKYRQVELTAQNFWDYFEIVERFYVNKDAFGDPASMNYTWYICLREECADTLYRPISECVVELKYPRYEGTITPDWNAQTGSLSHGSKVRDRESVLTFGSHLYEDMGLTPLYTIYDSTWCYKEHPDITGEIPARDPAEITVSRIKGSLYFR